ncbi:uncharacterized protein CG7065 [Scaptodrosophila lebanonensis]|uniref:Uncharacterized protein CG7065 n=1 Tax=Drosophila lebanonensis TaxID=7225 RepID=A0A6J2UEF3_DROLE|nr:uncharacterized protein CG7065 [Scaptodrosophila lebanonensis]XP_030386740.1 uncharacterized protein CG7065 [Scaptodrosophila lebanonensis]
MSFLPGEPVPPGFEEEMARTPIIHKQIESYIDGPLIGVEYAVELHENNQPRPDYFCVLCETCNDSRSIFMHWASMQHRNNFLKAHFQKAYGVLNKIRRKPMELAKATEILAEAIEKKYGRTMQLLSIAGEDFRRNQNKICIQIKNKFHFDECSGPDFVDVAIQALQPDSTAKTDETLKITLKISDPDKAVPLDDENSIHLDAISSDDENFGPADGKKLRNKIQQDEKQSTNRNSNRSPPAGGDKTVKSNIKIKLPTPKELSIQASHIAQERYKWEKFRSMFELQLKQLRDETETYESNPEKHPDYPDEWKQFWNRRYKQLQEEKTCDPNRYDYKPEWIAYWKERRVELFNIAVNKIKKDLQEKFKLGDDDEEQTKKLMDRYKIRVEGASPLPDNERFTSRENSPPLPRNDRRKPNFRSNRQEAVINISDDEHSSPPRRSNNRPYGRSRSRSVTPKRARMAGRYGRRSRTRSPVRRDMRRSGRITRSRSRTPRNKRSRSPYSRDPDHARLRDGRERTISNLSNHSRSRDDYADRRSLEHEYFKGDGYRPSRSYEQVETFRVLDSRIYPEYNQPTRSTSPAASSKDHDKAADDGPLTVVSVLRMLAALEDHLGSLGPKALNLLGKALAMEKVQANAADELLLNEDNCVFMELIKEKLRGLVIAEVLDDPQKVRVVKKLISNIAAIIFQVNSRGATASSEDKLDEVNKKKDYQLPFDKQIVSTKLASALLMKGYDNVTTADMIKMIHFFTLLVKVNRMREAENNSSLHFGEVVEQLGLKMKAATPIGLDLNELVKEVEQQLSKEARKQTAAVEAVKASVANSESSNGMESLTDSDLQTLLQNFKFLSSEEQLHLISHVRKLEVIDPPRVERLRKFVNLAELCGDGESCSDFLTRVVANANHGGTNDLPSTSRSSTAGIPTRRKSPPSRERERDRERIPSMDRDKSRRGPMRNSPQFMLDDDDDDDYNFDDLVMKAKDSNGKQTGAPIVPVESSPNALTFKPAASKISLKDTQNIIANLMGTLSNASGNNITSGKGSVPGSAPQMSRNNAQRPPMRSNLMPSQQRPQQHQQQQQQQQPQSQNPPQQQQQQQPQHPHQMQQHYGGGGGPQNMNHMAGVGHNNGPYYPGSYGNEQMGPGPAAGPQYNMQQPYNMQAGYGGYNQGPGPMGQQNFGGYGGGSGGPINPWANGPPAQQPYNNMPQNYMHPQQQPYNM